MLLDTANDRRRGDDCEEYEFKSIVDTFTTNDGRRGDDCEEYEFKSIVYMLDTANDGQRRGDDCEEYEFKSMVRCSI